jgi:uncharacterized protein YihD (DUF1040 family)
MFREANPRIFKKRRLKEPMFQWAKYLVESIVKSQGRKTIRAELGFDSDGKDLTSKVHIYLRSFTSSFCGGLQFSRKVENLDDMLSVHYIMDKSTKRKSIRHLQPDFLDYGCKIMIQIFH